MLVMFAAARKVCKKKSMITPSRVYQLRPNVYFCFVCLGSAFLGAQTNEEPVYELSAFEVTAQQDRGYYSTNSVTATRIGVPVAEIPLNITVLTETFIEDLNLESFSDLARYMTGAVGDSLNDSVRTIRGFTPLYTLRNGFRVYRPTVASNIERAELVKGPVSIFFGQAAPGGIINLIPKQPRFANSAKFRTTLGAYDKFAVDGDVNRILVEDKLALRISGLYEDSNDWRDYAFMRQEVFAPSVLWRPFGNPKLTVKASYEYMKEEFNRPNGNLFSNPQYLEDWANPPDDVVRRKFGLPSSATVAPALKLATQALWLTSTSQWAQDVENARGGFVYRDTDYVPYIAPQGWAINQAGPDASDINTTNNFTVEAQAELREGLQARYAFNWFENENDFLNVWRDQPNGDGTIDVTGNDAGQLWNELISHQFDVTWTVDFLGANHTFVVGAERVEDEFLSLSKKMDYSSVPSKTNSLGRVISGKEAASQWDPALDPAIRFSDIVIGFEDDPARQEGPNVRKGYYISYRGSWFNDRFLIMGGLRREDYTKRTILLNDDPQVDNDAETTPMIGAMYVIPDVGNVFVSYSENFNPNRSPLFVGSNATDEERRQLAPAETGVGMEAGFKLAMAETLTGTVSLYEVTRTNITQLDRDATQERNDGVQVYRPAGEQRTRGVEVDVLWRPNANYSLVFGYSWMFDAELVSDPSLDPTGTEAQILFSRRLESTPEHMVSIWNKYTFNDGRLEGLELGIGARYVSEHMPRASNYRSNLFNDASLVFDAMIAYNFSLRGVDYKVAMELENLTDEVYQIGHVATDDPFRANVSISASF